MKIAELANVGVEEGVNDPHIFKCIFLFGPIGAGKTTVARPLLSATGLRAVNIDNFNEMFIRKGEVPTGRLAPDQLERSWQLAQKQQENFIEGRLGLIIDNSGRNPEAAIGAIEVLMPLGYEFMMIFVDVSMETSIQRQKQRAQRQRQQWGTGRELDPETAAKYQQVKSNMGRYAAYFGPDRFVYVNNETKPDLTEATKKVNAFLRTPPSQPEARRWIQSQKGGNQVIAKQDKELAGAERQAAALQQFKKAPLSAKYRRN